MAVLYENLLDGVLDVLHAGYSSLAELPFKGLDHLVGKVLCHLPVLPSDRFSGPPYGLDNLVLVERDDAAVPLADLPDKGLLPGLYPLICEALELVLELGDVPELLVY